MPAETEIKIDTAKMTAVAQVVNNQMNIIRSCFSFIKQQSSDLTKNHWEGSSADAYAGNMKRLCSEQSFSGVITTNYVIKALEEYVLDLNKAAAEYEATERRLDTVISALPTDVFGI